MSAVVPSPLVGAAAVGCGLAAGVFFAFSAFVMPALDRLPAAQATAAMQSINRLAVTPLLMTALVGTALACLAAGAWAVTAWGDPRAPWIVAGALVYLVGVIGVTGGGNVPLNDTLATVHAHAPGVADDWRAFIDPWTVWNHVRTVAGLVAAGLLVVAVAAG